MSGKVLESFLLTENQFFQASTKRVVIFGKNLFEKFVSRLNQHSSKSVKKYKNFFLQLDRHPSWNIRDFLDKRWVFLGNYKRFFIGFEEFLFQASLGSRLNWTPFQNIRNFQGINFDGKYQKLFRYILFLFYVCVWKVAQVALVYPTSNIIL